MTRARDLALTIGTIMGVICLAWTAAVAFLGVTPLVVASGSMSPSIATGDLALARSVPAEELQRGDVVSVTASGSRVTHRIVDAELDDGTAVLTLKGDANRTADAGTYQVAAADRVFATIPRGGYVLTAVGSPLGVLVGGVLVAGLLVLAFGRGRGPRGGRRRAHVTAAGLVILALGVTMELAPVENTLAAFTDEPTLTTGSLAAHTVQRPDSVSCSSALLTATASWPEKDPKYDYEVVLRRVSTGNVVSTRQVNGAATSTTYSGLADFGLVVGLGAVDFTVEVRSKLANTTNWHSATTRNYGNIRVLAILIGATASCTT